MLECRPDLEPCWSSTTMPPSAPRSSSPSRSKALRCASTTGRRRCLADHEPARARLPGGRLSHARHRRARAGRAPARARGHAAGHPDQRPRQQPAAHVAPRSSGVSLVLEKPLSDSGLVESIRAALAPRQLAPRRTTVPHTDHGLRAALHGQAPGRAGGVVGRGIPAERGAARAAAPHRQRRSSTRAPSRPSVWLASGLCRASPWPSRA